MTSARVALAPEPREVLDGILARARALGERAVLIFDLDSTLFDNRPRQVVILREFGLARGLPALAANTLQHWRSGWDIPGAMRAVGLSAEEVEALSSEFKEFWRQRFFSSDYCDHDTEIVGASAFLREVQGPGATLVYLTGRHEEMRAGTVRAMKRSGMPTPERRVHLMMKPSLREDDDAFKSLAHRHVRDLGTVVAAFDNEPTHANGFRRSFPEARVVHLATDHSGRPVPLLEGIVSIPHFGR